MRCAGTTLEALAKGPRPRRRRPPGPSPCPCGPPLPRAPPGTHQSCRSRACSCPPSPRWTAGGSQWRRRPTAGGSPEPGWWCTQSQWQWGWMRPAGGRVGREECWGGRGQVGAGRRACRPVATASTRAVRLPPVVRTAAAGHATLRTCCAHTHQQHDGEGQRLLEGLVLLEQQVHEGDEAQGQGQRHQHKHDLQVEGRGGRRAERTGETPAQRGETGRAGGRQAAQSRCLRYVLLRHVPFMPRLQHGAATTHPP